MSSAAWIVVPAGIGLFAAWRIGMSSAARRRARYRLFEKLERREQAAGSGQTSELWGSWLERWLFISGFRDSRAPARFLVAQSAALAVGMLFTLVVLGSGLLSTGVQWLNEIPGGVGDLLAPILGFAPWILFVLVGFVPVTRVRARRRAIVESVEADLPMTLALLATLVESGLGFDASVDRILGSMDAERPLVRELELFRSESRAGVPRLACFRALSHRLDLISVSTFVSAMVHSEHVGGGVAESLRRQADEVWNRRRESAIQRAQTLPTKLAVPLVLCFLPGIFVYTFGPALAEFLRIAESVVNQAE